MQHSPALPFEETLKHKRIPSLGSIDNAMSEAESEVQAQSPMDDQNSLAELGQN